MDGLCFGELVPLRGIGEEAGGKRDRQGSLYPFARAAGTKNHTLGGLNSRNV